MPVTIQRSPRLMWSSATGRSVRKLRHLYEEHRAAGHVNLFYGLLQEACESGEIDRQSFSIREAFVQFVEDDRGNAIGRDLIEELDPERGNAVVLSEANVDTAQFANITGQIVYSELVEKFNDPAFIGAQLVTTTPTKFDGEKVAGVANLDDSDITNVAEAAAYPRINTGEVYYETPSTVKRGAIVPVTKEAIFFDRTGLVLQRAGEVGHTLGLDKEKRILAEVVGLNTTYKRNGAAAVGPYAASGDGRAWVNVVASNALVDWTDIDAAEQAFAAMNDPDTGNAIDNTGKTLLVPSALVGTAMRILNATEVRHGTNPVSVSSSPISGYSHVTSRQVHRLTGSATTWFVGNFKKAFRYMQNWPIQVVQAPPNATEEFNNDVVAQFKASERGIAATVNPWYVIKCTA